MHSDSTTLSRIPPGQPPSGRWIALGTPVVSGKAAGRATSAAQAIDEEAAGRRSTRRYRAEVLPQAQAEEHRGPGPARAGSGTRSDSGPPAAGRRPRATVAAKSAAISPARRPPQ